MLLLMGLRQLFSLIDELLDRLIFLSYGLAVILGFIGVKLLNVPEISTGLSILSPKGQAKNMVSGAKRHATEYVDLNYETDIAERETIFNRMLREEEELRKAHAEHDQALQREGRL
jgi:tellurite resistance protein TerC